MSDIIEEALDLFTEQFQDSDELKDLATALLKPTEKIESTIEALLLERWIDTAIGMQLDKLGDIVGVERRGRGDEAYRAAIRFQIFINISKTEPETLIKATRILSNGDFIRYWENPDAGFQLFTNGENVLDVSGSVVNNFIIELEDNSLLELDDGSNLLTRITYEPPESLAVFLKSIAPAAINKIALSFSLGELPLFGFGGDFISAQLILDDEGHLILDDGSNLDIILPEIAPSADGFIGFAEMLLQKLVLDDEGELAISSNIVEPINAQLKTEGIFDFNLPKLTLVEREIDLENVIVADIALSDFKLSVAMQTAMLLQQPEEFIFADENSFPLELDDGGNLIIWQDSVAEYVLSFDDDSLAELVLENENELADLLTDASDQFVVTNESVQSLHNFVLENNSQLQAALQSFITLPVNLVTNDGSVIILDDSGLLEAIDMVEGTVENFLQLDNNDAFGLINYLDTPGEGFLILDNGSDLELHIFNVLDEQTPLLIFDQNQTPDNGGKLVSAMVA